MPAFGRVARATQINTKPGPVSLAKEEWYSPTSAIDVVYKYVSGIARMRNR
jgi:hypothetical protein